MKIWIVPLLLKFFKKIIKTTQKHSIWAVLPKLSPIQGVGIIHFFKYFVFQLKFKAKDLFSHFCIMKLHKIFFCFNGKIKNDQNNVVRKSYKSMVKWGRGRVNYPKLVIEEQSTTFSPNKLGSKVFRNPTIFDTRPFWIHVACRAGSPGDFLRPASWSVC